MSDPFAAEAFLKEIRALLGGETDAFLSAMDDPAVSSLRLNSLRTGAREAMLPFSGEEVTWCPDGRYILPDTRPGRSPLHFAGACYIQEASAMAPAMVLRPAPGERVLDLCAAPGGKAGQLAAFLKGEGLLLANEPDMGRAKVLSANLERLGIQNALVSCAAPEELSDRLAGFFDAALVDAPCSGEGMFRRDPQAREQWSEGSPAGCAARQARILDHAARMLRPGGRLVYSTCTFNRAENEETVARFLERHPEFIPGSFSLPGAGQSKDGCLRLWPHRVRGEGHFVALLQKADGSEQTRAPRPRPAEGERKAASQALDALSDIVPELSGTKEAGVLLQGDRLFLPPPDAPHLPGVRLLRQGLHLGRVGRGYVEPDHALAMSGRAPARALPLGEDQVAAALAGETIPCDGKGWLLMTHQGLPIGWAKASGGVAKNHIPKGLRQRF